MKDQTLTIEINTPLTGDVMGMRLAGDASAISAPGQFLNLAVDGCFLRRPISIWDWDADHVSILYKVVGKGTAALAALQPGSAVRALLPLGNGFDVTKCTERTVLVAGGIGMPPIYGVAKAMAARGLRPHVVLGFRTGDDVLPPDTARLGLTAETFGSLGIAPVVMTEDGAGGRRGLVTDALREMDFDYVCACGPKAMLQAVHALAPAGQFSFEERMGCGIGACMGCTCRTKGGYKRICKDGPVLDHEEIIW